jgi:hypothetical protein
MVAKRPSRAAGKKIFLSFLRLVSRQIFAQVGSFAALDPFRSQVLGDLEHFSRFQDVRQQCDHRRNENRYENHAAEQPPADTPVGFPLTVDGSLHQPQG